MPLAHVPVTIHTLTDDIFLEIFRELLTSYLPSELCPYLRQNWYLDAEHAAEWQSLVHVCQRWRNIIYGSPRYLDLHIHCSSETPFSENFDRWPMFPLALDYTIYPEEYDGDVVFALEHPDRVDRIDLTLSHLDYVGHNALEAMQVPFPALTYLDLARYEDTNDVEEFELSDRFLGGSSPRLQHIHLDAISFPTLPELLLSARGLVCLELRNLPANAYDHISPEAMVRGLAGLTKLTNLFIDFIFTNSDSDDQPEKRGHPDPPMRAALPALTRFEFAGENVYLEALIAQIDSPQVEILEVRYRRQEDEIRQLSQFIGRTASLESTRFRNAQVIFSTGYYAQIKLDREHHQARLSLNVPIEDDYYHVLRLLGQMAAVLSNVDHLSVEMGEYWTENGDKKETSKWLSFLRLFPAVEVLHVSGGVAVNIASTLEKIVGETVTEVLPALRLLHFRNVDEPPGSTKRYLALRKLAGRPVTVVDKSNEARGMREEKTFW